MIPASSLFASTVSISAEAIDRHGVASRLVELSIENVPTVGRHGRHTITEHRVAPLTGWRPDLPTVHDRPLVFIA